MHIQLPLYNFESYPLLILIFTILTNFAAINSVLTNQFVVACPWMHKHENHIEMVEEKIEVLATWFNETRLACMVPIQGSVSPTTWKPIIGRAYGPT